MGIDWPAHLLTEEGRKRRLTVSYPWLKKIQPWTEAPAPWLEGAPRRKLWILDDGTCVYYAVDNGPGQKPYLYEIHDRNTEEVIIRCGRSNAWVKTLAEGRVENEARVAQGFAPKNDL